jgi:hypothetical protein
MPVSGSDPYKILEVSPGATDEQIRAAYRRLVQLHHPDHNAGSAESARRFEEVQEAYARIRRLRGSGTPAPEQPPPSSPDLEARLAAMEHELRQANEARKRAEQARAAARRAAREAAETAEGEQRPSDEELGYITTDDSLSKILADAREEFLGHLPEAHDQPAGKRVADLLDELAAKLRGEKRG